MSETAGGKRLPLGKCCRVSFFISLTVGEVAFLIEMIVDRRVDGDKFLKCSRSSEAQHRPLSSSKSLM